MAENSTGRRLPDFAKRLIIKYSAEGKPQAEVLTKVLKLLSHHHSFHTTRSTVSRFIRRYNETGEVNSNLCRVGSPKKILPIHREFINMWLSENNDLSTKDIQQRLENELRLAVSLFYIRKIRIQLGWTTRRLQYCQMISHKNKLARLTWCRRVFNEKERFLNVIFADETTVEMCSSGRIYFQKSTSDIKTLPTKRPKPKHSYKVHVWGGISYHGRTDICIFTGIMDLVTYQGILDRNLLPFARRVFPDGFRLYQDNDSKHNSRSTQQWIRERGLSDAVMETPASSPDLNPIENLWAAMKVHLQTKVKPKKKDELVTGIREFWSTVSVEKCVKYIDHIHKVIPEVILNYGNTTRY